MVNPLKVAPAPVDSGSLNVTAKKPKRRIRFYIGKPPPPLSAYRGVSVPAKSLTIASVTTKQSRPHLPKKKRRIDEVVPAVPPPILKDPVTVRTDDVMLFMNLFPLLQRPVQKECEPVAIGCPRCDWIPDCPPHLNKSLRGLVINPRHVALLRDLGLYTDAHLQLFLEWTPEDRRFCLDWIEPDQMTPYDKALLLKGFADRVTPAPSNKRKVQGGNEEIRNAPHSGILQPGPEDEEKITDPLQSGTDLLRKFMQWQGTSEGFYGLLVSV